MASNATIDFASFNEARKAFGFCAKGNWEYTHGDCILNVNYDFKANIVENPNMEKISTESADYRSNHTRLTIYSTGFSQEEMNAYAEKVIAHVGNGAAA